MATPEWAAMRQLIVRRLSTVRIGEVVYKTSYYGESYGEIKIHCGEGEEERTQTITSESKRYTARLNQDFYFEKDLVALTVNSVFGVVRPGEKKAAVPTYFLKAERLAEMLIENPKLELGDEVHNAKCKLQLELDAFANSEEFDQSLKNQRVEHTIEEIRRTLMRFRDATPETLRTALDLFILNDVMDT